MEESNDGLNPNWELIHRCGVWKVLGVGECDNCPCCVKCWGKNSDLDYIVKEK